MLYNNAKNQVLKENKVLEHKNNCRPLSLKIILGNPQFLRVIIKVIFSFILRQQGEHLHNIGVMNLMMIFFFINII